MLGAFGRRRRERRSLLSPQHRALRVVGACPTAPIRSPPSPMAFPCPTHAGLLSLPIAPAAAIQLHMAQDPRSGLVRALAALAWF